MAKAKTGRLVYSTDQGRLCPDCQQPQAGCRCREQQRSVIPEGDGIVRVRYETKGRGGKGVTVIEGVLLAEEALKTLGKALKARCGTGGTVKEGVIEIQGDQRALLSQELEQRGYRVKRVGG